MCNGMPYVDMLKPEQYIVRTSLVMLEMMRTNHKGFTKEKSTMATEAHDAMTMMASPCEDKLKQVMSSMISNCDITPADLANQPHYFIQIRVVCGVRQ